MVLITSRASRTGLVVTEAAHRLTLDLLTPAEAHELVTGIIGHERGMAEPDAVDELIRLCARLPLALPTTPVTTPRSRSEAPNSGRLATVPLVEAINKLAGLRCPQT
jgi:hypothetical protein